MAARPHTNQPMAAVRFLDYLGGNRVGNSQCEGLLAKHQGDADASRAVTGRIGERFLKNPKRRLIYLGAQFSLGPAGVNQYVQTGCPVMRNQSF